MNEHLVSSRDLADSLQTMHGGGQRDGERRDLFRWEAGVIPDDPRGRHRHILRVGAPDVQARQCETRRRNRRADVLLLILQWIPRQGMTRSPI